MGSRYLLVQWVQEGNKYSVVKRNSIVDANDKANRDENLIGRTIQLFWKSKQYPGYIIQCGEKVNMSHEMQVLISQHSSLTDSPSGPNVQLSTCTNHGTIATDIESVLGELNSGSQNSEHDENILLKQRVASLERQLLSVATKATKYKRKFKALKRTIDDKDDDSVERSLIGGNVYLPKSQLDTILALSENANELARNLLKSLYSDNELIGHSLFGKKCNANINKPANPPIESLRRDAIILFTLNRFGLNLHHQKRGNRVRNPVLQGIHQTLGDFLRYRTRKSKAHDQTE